MCCTIIAQINLDVKSLSDYLSGLFDWDFSVDYTLFLLGCQLLFSDNDAGTVLAVCSEHSFTTVLGEDDSNLLWASVDYISFHETVPLPASP